MEFFRNLNLISMSLTSDKIKTLIGELALAEKTAKYFDDLKISYNQKLQENEALVRVVEKELADVVELEKLSVKGLFYKALGNKSDQLEKERQEYLAAALKQRGLARELELEKYEIDLVGKRLDDIKLKQTELGELKKLREKEILTDSSEELHAVLREILNKMDQMHKRAVEVNEAIVAGNELSKTFVSSLNNLKRSHSWGKWDMAGGKGYMKKSTLDIGLEEAYRASGLLEKYKRELADIGLVYQGLNLQLGQVSTFMDIIFDNLISDWIIQKKIKSAVTTIESVFDKVKMIQQTVASEGEKIRYELEALERQKDQLLEK